MSWLVLLIPIIYIVLPILAGIFINKLLFKYLKKNRWAFPVSLSGSVIVLPILYSISKLYVQAAASQGTNAAGVVMVSILSAAFLIVLSFIGTLIYAFSSGLTSIVRKLKKKK